MSPRLRRHERPFPPDEQLPDPPQPAGYSLDLTEPGKRAHG